MNQRPPVLKFSEVIPGFIQFKSAEGRSPRTLEGYRHDLQMWLNYAGDFEVANIEAVAVRAFIAYLRTDYQPHRLSGRSGALSAKTVRNFWASISAFFSWFSREFDLPNPMAKVPAPSFPKAEVEPFKQDQVEAMLRACDSKREAQTSQRRRFTMRRHTALRDRAIILTLLDTGLRASELCALDIGDFDLKSGRLTVRHGPSGGAKGSKGRSVYVGKAAGRALWRWLVSRSDKDDAAAPLFVARRRRMTRDSLRQLVRDLGEKANIANAHPHKFRHTFAISYLRAGGDVFTLQRLLGHADLAMVLAYSRIAEVDIEQAHRRASPADAWRL